MALIAVAATIIKKTSDFPAVTTPASGDFFLTETASGATNNKVTFANLKSSINLSNTFGLGSANTLAIWSGTNLLGYIINGVGILTNDGAGNFGYTTNLAIDLTINNLTVTNLTLITVNNTTNLFSVAKGGHLTVNDIFTLLPAGPSKLLRTDVSTNVVAATIGPGLLFDGTTLYPSNLVNAQIDTLDTSKITTGTLSTNRLPALNADLGNLAATITTGDLLQYDGSHLVRLPASTAGYVLTANGAGAASTYQPAAIPTNFPNAIFTNYVQMPWTTLTMTGSNVSTINLAAGSMFKLTLTNNAFIGAPSGLPGTNLAQTIQIHVAQDGTGVRTLTLTNAGWVLSGLGTSTNAVPAITTNANAVSVLTFSTSPFSSTLLYGVLATTP
jgi:hypothetical protein